MALRLQEFDHILKKDTDTAQTRENTLAEYFFPDVRFRYTTIDPDYTKPQDIASYGAMTPQFSQGKKLYFADREVRDLVYPNRSDGAAYGSLLFTPCRDFQERKDIRVLIVDDSTGATGPNTREDVIPRAEALKLVGDCYGTADRNFMESLTGGSRRPVQFRLGIKPQEECEVFRIGKGTLAPMNLDRLSSVVHEDRGEGGTRYRTGYDLVLPTSSFKGRKGQDAIAPGEYTLTVGIGIKTFAEYSHHRLGTQVLVNYPNGVETDILPRLRTDARSLAESQMSPHKAAQSYVERHDRTKAFSDAAAELPGTFEKDLDDMLTEAFGEEATERRDPAAYRIIKADLENHGQLLDHPFVNAALKKFIRTEWQDLALGRGVSFHSGLAQPSIALGKDEVSVPFLPEGEELIVLRSPVLNSNGVILLTNRHLPETRHLDGTIHIHPETAATHLQADFDGDRLAFDLASKFPALTAEIRESHRPENRYPDIVKRDKVPYGNLPFHEIALLASSDQVGSIANRIQAAIALRWETTLLPKEERGPYVQEVAAYYRAALKQNAGGIPADFRPMVDAVATLPRRGLSETQVEGALTTLQTIQRQVIGRLSTELQVAVDGFKSADRPNDQVIQQCKLVSGYREVGWIEEKSLIKRAPDHEKPFYARPMGTTNRSPIDLMIATANTQWSENPLTMAPSRRFEPLFEPLSPDTPGASDINAIAKEILRTDTRNCVAVKTLREMLRADKDLGRHYVVARSTTNPDRDILITNIDRHVGPTSPIWEHPDLRIRLVQTQDARGRDAYSAIAEVPDQDGRRQTQCVGTVSPISVKRFEGVIQPNMVLIRPEIEVSSPITETRIKAASAIIDEYRQSIRDTTPPELHGSLQSAIWHYAFHHTEAEYKLGYSAFTVFTDKVVEQLRDFHASRIQVTGLQYPTNEHQGREFKGERVTLEVIKVPPGESKSKYDRLICVDGKPLGTFGSDSLALQPGTKARAVVTTDPPTSVTVKLDDLFLRVTQIKNHSFAGQRWEGEKKDVSITFSNEKAVAVVDGKRLGVFDAVSVNKLRERGLLGANRPFSASLHNPPPSTATIEIDQSTLFYPWEQDRLRHEYEKLAHFVANHPDITVQTARDIDRAVAAIVYTRDPASRDAALILTQSDQVRDWKTSLPNLEYLKEAQNYVRNVMKEAKDVSAELVRFQESLEQTRGLSR